MSTHTTCPSNTSENLVKVGQHSEKYSLQRTWTSPFSHAVCVRRGKTVNSTMHVATSESRGELQEERERQTKRDKEIKFETIGTVWQ